MTAKRRKKGSGYSVFVGFVVVPLLVINLFVPNSKPICKFSEWHDGLLLFPTPPKGRETVYGTLYRMFSDSGAYHLGVSN